MTAPTPIERGERTTWIVREAGAHDVDGVGIAVEELLLELGGTPPSPTALRATVLELVEGPSRGVLLVAESVQGEIVGFLGVSWQTAVRIPGRYGQVQELWVHPGWRSRAIGAELLEALRRTARELGVERIEVGLPSERFAGVHATESFYRDNGFQPIGLRMKLLIDDTSRDGRIDSREERKDASR